MEKKKRRYQIKKKKKSYLGVIHVLNGLPWWFRW